MKRFYKAGDIASVTGGWQVTLDGRAVRTVKGAGQIVPTRALAQMLAAEWERQGERIDPAAFPARDMADYAIDVIAPSPREVAAKITAYGDTDTLLYRADPDEPLHARQLEVWEPILTRFETREKVSLARVSGIIHRPQEPAALAALCDRIAALSPFTLAALETMTSLAASLVIGLSALQSDADASALWDAASLEEEWQASQWGRDEEAEARRDRRRADFFAAHAFAKAAIGDDI